MPRTQSERRHGCLSRLPIPASRPHRYTFSLISPRRRGDRTFDAAWRRSRTPQLAAPEMSPTYGRSGRRPPAATFPMPSSATIIYQRFGFDSDWIVKRTGILERRHALPHQATSDLCHEASNRCLDQPASQPQDIDLIVAGHVHAGYVVSLDGLPGAGPAEDRAARPSKCKRPAPASCTRSSPGRPTSSPAPATWP